jgi:ubiquinol-cytochrome c reductase cytochrome b subunit
MAKPAKTAPRREVPPDRPNKQPGPLMKFMSGPATWADERTGIANMARGKFPDFINLRKLFPDHWSFMLGEIALYSFVVLLLTGVFLTLWFNPSMGDVKYDGSYQLLRGLNMSHAYDSTLHITFDVRGGLLIRQIHHWAALIFVASMMVHMMRNFFTGAFRKPRDINWVIGATLLFMAITEGFLGYSMPDDLLSGTGVRIIFGAVEDIPVIGTYIDTWLLGGAYPGDMLIPRMYMLHILLIPAVLLALIGLHLILVLFHMHTQYPGAGKTEKNVVGYPIFPVYIAKISGWFFIVFGVITIMASVLQINPVWKYGPYNPAEVSAGSQPDFYIGYLEGALRMMPNFEWHIGHTTWSWNVFIPGIIGFIALPLAVAIYPFIEKWITGDNNYHHLLDRPRNAANRTGIGVAAITVYVVLMVNGANDIIADVFSTSLELITVVCRIAIFLGPIAAFIITKRTCIGLQRSAKERVLEGAESGVISRAPSGQYSETETPISQSEAYLNTQHVQQVPIETAPAETDANGVQRKASRKERARAPFTRWWFGHDVPKPTQEEIEEEQQRELESGDGEHHGEGDQTPDQDQDSDDRQLTGGS